MPSTDRDTREGPGSAPLKVYPPGLDRTAGLVDDGLNNNFAPSVRDVFAAYSVGTPFGAQTLSPALASAREVHHECLVRASETLARYVWASSVLVEAVRTVRATYSDADLAAAANSKAVEKILTDALAAARAASTPAGSPQPGPGSER